MHVIYSKRFTRSITIIAGIYLLYYIFWRGMETLNPDFYFFSILLFIAEFQGILNYFLFAMMTWNTNPMKRKKNPDKRPKTIDVFVPTYNEDLEVLEATLIGCMNMRGSHKTYVLDDGRRPDVKKLADRLGCIYLTREDNRHAKAGNINAALKKTNGEVIAIFDADMVPQPDFLEKTLGYFEDERVAIVQLPQEFYNVDSVQHHNSKDFWHEQKLFYRVIQPGKDRINATFWCGSPSIISRKAFEEIGGVATETITEDFQTSIRLNAKGWKIRFHNEVLAYGIAPQSLHAFNLQRLRWAQGAMQIFRSKDNPLFIKGLTWQQRLSHFSAIFTYFDSFQKLIYLVIPSLYLLTGILPIKVENGLSFIAHWLPYFVLTLLANISLGRGYFKYFSIEKYNILKMFTFIKASLIILWPKTLSFKVTPKGVNQSIKQKERQELFSHMFILIILLCSIFFGIFKLFKGLYDTEMTLLNVFIALFWAAFNLSLLVFTLKSVLKRLYYRQDYRFPVSIKAYLVNNKCGSIEVNITDISRYGLGLNCQHYYTLSEEVTIFLNFDHYQIRLPGNIVYDKIDDSMFTRKLGVRFNELNFEDQKKLIYLLFVILPKNNQQPFMENHMEELVEKVV